MKVTKFGQSCLLIEGSGGRLLVDPGSFFADRHKISELGKVDAVLYTHEHIDHFDPEIWDQLRAAGVPGYANAAVAGQSQGIEVIHSGQVFEAAGFKIKAVDLKHFTAPNMLNPPHNTGFVIDGVFLHPGDGVEQPSFEIANAAIPIGGPSGGQFAKEAVEFARAIGANTVIPIHYDHYKFDPAEWAKLDDGIETIVLADGQSTEF